MKQAVVLSLLFIATLAAPNAPQETAPSCSDDKCAPPNCRCSTTNAPKGVDPDKFPQFVFFTFDDAVQGGNYDYYTQLFYNKTNSDGCPVQATYFVAHEYTDYTKVHDLYLHSHEIALHSITHSPDTNYWLTISVENMTKEFGGERDLIAKFANIPEEDIKGMRLPFLELAGDITFEVAKDIGLLYDCSWPTQTFRNPGLWPYTLDYKSTQDCSVGTCPSESIPGLWVIPMLDWTDQKNVVCSMVDACVNIPDDNPEDLRDWFIENFNISYHGNRAPFGFYVHAAYFSVKDTHFDAYLEFVQYLQTLPDVFLVTPSRAIEWIKNPVEIGSPDWPSCTEVQDLGCHAMTCELQKEDDPYNPNRYMTFCGTECPAEYPWLDNPLGD